MQINVQINEICKLLSSKDASRPDAEWLNRCFGKVSLKTQMTRDIKPSRVSHLASTKEAVGPPAGRFGHCSGCLVLYLLDVL